MAGKVSDSNSANARSASPKIFKGAAVGPRLRFRDIELSDAAFMLALRTDERKGRYLSPTSADLELQKDYIKRYAQATDEAYFIVETLDRRPVGTIRIYDPRGTSFCWGSWILADDAPKSSAVESTLMIYQYGLGLGFDRSHFDVRKANERVWQYHERCGAKRTGESEIDYFYSIDNDAIQNLFNHYARRVPNGIQVSFRT